MAGELRTKRVYEPASPEDGVRVLVDRIWPRGMTKEEVAISFWLKEIAPSAGLRKWFGHDPEHWVDFRRRYREELDANQPAVQRLRDVLEDGRLTLVYGAKDEKHNQALVLADYLREGRRA